MFWLLTKKKFGKELKKLTHALTHNSELIGEHNNSIAELTSQSLNNRILIEKNQDSIKSQNEKIARLEGMVSVMLQGKSQSLPVSSSLPKSQNKFETRLMNKVKRNKKSLIMAEISKLTDSNSTIDIFETIVKEKGLCSKASFYRYIASLKSQNPIETKTELRQ